MRSNGFCYPHLWGLDVVLPNGIFYYPMAFYSITTSTTPANKYIPKYLAMSLKLQFLLGCTLECDGKT